MTKAQRGYQIRLLQRLHLSKRYINIYKDDRMSYKHFLKTNLGVESSKELSIDVLIKLVDYMEMKIDEVPTNFASSQQVAFIKHLWSINATNKDNKSLLSFAKRTVNPMLKAIEHITPIEATHIIAGIKKLKPKYYANNQNYRRG